MVNQENIANGRIDLLGPIGTQFNFADQIPVKECTSYCNALNGVWTDTQLSKEYFSVENIKRLQELLIRGVLERSNGQYHIGYQDCDQLKIIMRAIYLQNTKNLPDKIPDQLNKLNNLVLEYAVPQVYNEAVGYMKYLRAVSTMHTLPQYPVNSSVRTKTLELKHFFTRNQQ